MSARVVASGLGVCFQLDRQQRPVTPALARLRRRGGSVWGLRELGFELAPGDAVALIGSSGSGKTTLLRCLAGVLQPDAGTLRVDGRVGSLLAVDAGLMGRLTGAENAELLGVLAGLSRRETRAQLPEMRTVSGLGDAFERPVSTYSQGMRARLTFSVVDCIGADVLLLDEVHEAFDHDYRALVAERARAVTARGGVVVAAGHDHPLLAEMCQRALEMDGGRIVRDGPFESVRRHYRHEP
jgi:ABC-type polysaccharide/polyol phosphate transport system ATPase subunit